MDTLIEGHASKMRLIDSSLGHCCLPTFICVGAEKCGTTALYDELKSHPDIYMSPIKETNFFATDVQLSNFRTDYRQHEINKNLNLEEYFSTKPLREIWGAYVREYAQYLQLFDSGQEFPARGEISNSYLYSQDAAQNIADTLPDAKVIVLLRNPVHRAFSQYRAMVRDGRTSMNNLIDEVRYDLQFDDRRWGSCHGYIDHGMYSVQLRRLFNAIDRRRIKVVFCEDLFRDRENTLTEIFDFVGVESIARREIVSNRNRSVSPRSAGLVRWLTKTGIKSRLSSVLPDKSWAYLKRMAFSDKKENISETEYEFLKSFYTGEKETVETLLGMKINCW